MGRKVLAAIVVIQFLVICALGLMLAQGRRQSAERERVDSALADIRGALSVGADYTQFQEKVQAFAAAVENFRAKGGAKSDLTRFEESQKLYKDSLDLWSEEINLAGLYERRPHGRYVPTALARIAREQDLDPSEGEYPYKIFADELVQQLWAEADQTARGANTQQESAPEKALPKR
jgi:hypothetical protein